MPGAADGGPVDELLLKPWRVYLLAVVPRRPLLDGLEAKLVEGEPRRRHGDPPFGVAAEDPDPDAAGDELADDGEGGEGGVVPGPLAL
ncbi:unnamed protein product [Urochloa humidicola]